MIAAVMWELCLSLDYAPASEPSDCKAPLLHAIGARRSDQPSLPRVYIPKCGELASMLWRSPDFWLAPVVWCSPPTGWHFSFLMVFGSLSIFGDLRLLSSLLVRGALVST